MNQPLEAFEKPSYSGLDWMELGVGVLPHPWLDLPCYYLWMEGKMNHFSSMECQPYSGGIPHTRILKFQNKKSIFVESFRLQWGSPQF
jgi:hypothetical protein